MNVQWFVLTISAVTGAPAQMDIMVTDINLGLVAQRTQIRPSGPSLLVILYDSGSPFNQINVIDCIIALRK